MDDSSSSSYSWYHYLIGSLIILAILAAFVFLIIYFRKKKNDDPNDNDPNNNDPNNNDPNNDPNNNTSNCSSDAVTPESSVCSSIGEAASMVCLGNDANPSCVCGSNTNKREKLYLIVNTPENDSANQAKYECVDGVDRFVYYCGNNRIADGYVSNCAESFGGTPTCNSKGQFVCACTNSAGVSSYVESDDIDDSRLMSSGKIAPLFTTGDGALTGTCSKESGLFSDLKCNGTIDLMSEEAIMSMNACANDYNSLNQCSSISGGVASEDKDLHCVCGGVTKDSSGLDCESKGSVAKCDARTNQWNCSCRDIFETDSNMYSVCGTKWKNANMVCVDTNQTSPWQCACGTEYRNNKTSPNEGCPGTTAGLTSSKNVYPSNYICNTKKYPDDPSRWSWDCVCGEELLLRTEYVGPTVNDPYGCTFNPSTYETPICHYDGSTYYWGDCNCSGVVTGDTDNLRSTSAESGAIKTGGCDPAEAVCNRSTKSYVC